MIANDVKTNNDCIDYFIEIAFIDERKCNCILDTVYLNKTI